VIGCAEGSGSRERGTGRDVVCAPGLRESVAGSGYGGINFIIAILQIYTVE
jgi:hypothetical protein